MARKQRSINFSDEVFDGLKGIVTYRQLKGEKATISSVVEELIQLYLKEHSREIEALCKLKSTLASQPQGAE